jgi:glycosyltransferase involved in cell wall biosynthesis
LGSLSFREIADTLSRASIYVLPAKYEPFGLTVLEAALSGCALVLGDIPSLREIWKDNAIYVKPGNEKSLTDAINFLIKDDDFREEIAEKAQKHSKNFSVNKMCAEYLSLYSALISNQNIKGKVRNEY